MTEPAPANAPAPDALGRLAVYRQRREALHDDVRQAIADGATQADVARASGLSRQYVAKLVTTSA